MKKKSDSEYKKPGPKKGCAKVNGGYRDKIIPTPEMIENAYKLSSALLNNQQIARNLKICPDVFYRFMREHELFANAIRDGKADKINELANDALRKCKKDNNILQFILKSKAEYMEHDKKEALLLRKREIILKEKIFKLSTEKFVSELAERHSLDKNETLDLLNKHLNENKI